MGKLFEFVDKRYSEDRGAVETGSPEPKKTKTDDEL